MPRPDQSTKALRDLVAWIDRWRERHPNADSRRWFPGFTDTTPELVAARAALASAESDASVTARLWPKPLTPAEREQAILDVLARLGGWEAPVTVQRVLRDDGQRLAPGTTRSILDRLADAGRCERQYIGGTSATFRAMGSERE